MHPFSFLPLLCALALTAQPARDRKVEGGSVVKDSASAADTGKQTPSGSAATNPEATTGQYRLLGILDPERDSMVAFALKVPRDWKAEQSLKRRWEGAVGHPQVYLALRSPDGSSQIEYLPSRQYLYSEGPMTSNLREQKRSLGLPTQTAPNEVPVMPPTEYVKQFLLPELARLGKELSDEGNEHTAPQSRDENGQTKLRGSVDGTTEKRRPVKGPI